VVPEVQTFGGLQMRTICGVPVRTFTFDAAKQNLDTAFENCRCQIVAFANANALNIATSNTHFREILQQAIILNDGIGINLASLLLFGEGFIENLNGTDFIPRYLRSTKNCYGIFLLGAKPGVAELAATKLMKIAPQHNISGFLDGYFAASETYKVVEYIRNSKADILLVAMGNPAQELWLQNNLAATGCRLGFGVGALFDFLSGEASRSPRWVRELSLEWAYRLIREPRRLGKRYVLGAPVFVAKILTHRLFTENRTA